MGSEPLRRLTISGVVIVQLLGFIVFSRDAMAAPVALPVPAAGASDTGAAAAAQHIGSAPAVAQWNSNNPESAKAILQQGLTIDIVAAEAAARPAEQLPSQYLVHGVIDPQSPLFSEEPGVLVPLAQAHTPVGDWLAAVEAAGPSTPLSDPMLVGTIFVPHDEAFEQAYPQLRQLKLQGKAVAEAFSNVSTPSLALQLNCLTVPGPVLKLDELWPGRLLKTAGLGAIKVISNRAADKPAHLQHQPSGLQFSITEADLQSGNAVAHVIDVLLPAALLAKEAPSPDSLADAQYRSVMAALQDPARQLQAFAFLVQKAALTTLMEDSKDAFTLFAPDDKAMEALMSLLPVWKREQLLTNATLADAFVSSHLVLGTGLGSKALEALLPAGQLRTPQGNVVVRSTTGRHQQPSKQLPSGAVALIEAGRPLPEATPTPAAPAPAAAESAQVQPTADGFAAGPAADAQQARTAALSGADTAAAAAAAATAPLDPDAAVSDSSHLVVAESGVVLGDLLGGKAVLHVVDRVLISPGLSRELGLMPSPGYDVLDPPPPPAAASSGVQQLSTPGFAGWVLSMVLAMWLCLL